MKKRGGNNIKIKEQLPQNPVRRAHSCFPKLTHGYGPRDFTG